jgi:hypothetical protein
VWYWAHHTNTHSTAPPPWVAPPGRTTPETLRGVWHGAMRVYLTRFLNVPPARFPEPATLDDLPRDAAALEAAFLAALDRQGQVGAAARLAVRWLALGHDPAALLPVFAKALLREDADFHTYQLVEAGARQFAAWPPGEERNAILIALARYLAAHSPTDRAQLQTALVARRLARGEALHEEA